MKNEEILKKAMEQAEKNGYKFEGGKVGNLDFYEDFVSSGFGDDTGFMEIIFDHKFAKAFWGEGIIQVSRTLIDGTLVSADFHGPEWKYQLQQMVLEEDPIKYLEQFLKDES